MKEEFSHLQQATQIAQDFQRRIEQEGLPAVLDLLREQGLDEAAIQSVFDENDIIDPQQITLSGYMAFKIACDLLAAEQNQFNNTANAQIYRQMTSGVATTYECI
jgi:hypothetical protein